MKCSYCGRELLEPVYMESSHPYCDRQCFCAHMERLSDHRAVQSFLVEGYSDMGHHQKQGMVRNGLLRYIRKEKRFELTNKGQEILASARATWCPL